MKTLKDTATLVVLLLLALTVRVDSRNPSTIDVGTPAHAATQKTPVWELEPDPQPEAEAVIEAVRNFVQPMELGPMALALPGVVAIPQEKGRRMVFELDAKRVVSFSFGDSGLRLHVLEDAEPVDPPSPSEDSPAADPNSCDAHRARISC